MKKTALITGASSGIGKELAIIHAKKEEDLVIVARREKELNDLKKHLETEYKVNVHVIVSDLSNPNSPNEIYNEIKSRKIKVEYLINNAGYGAFGEFHTQDMQMLDSMIDVNVKALVKLTHLFLQDMLQRNSGKILQVASAAGFMPGPMNAIYYATKAFVVSFSQAMAQELSNTNVTVTTLCPGPTHSEFAKVAGLEHLREKIIRKLPTSELAAQAGYKAMLQGKLVEINEFKLRFIIDFIIPFLPRRFLLKKTARLMNGKLKNKKMR